MQSLQTKEIRKKCIDTDLITTTPVSYVSRCHLFLNAFWTVTTFFKFLTRRVTSRGGRPLPLCSPLRLPRHRCGSRAQQVAAASSPLGQQQCLRRLVRYNPMHRERESTVCCAMMYIRTYTREVAAGSIW